MEKINIIDAEGFYIGDFIVGESGESRPESWTADLLPDGYYKAQYQGGTREEETGEVTGGAWFETGEVPPVDYLTPATTERDALMSAATIAIAPLQDAADLDEATEEEAALLKKWKQYRVALNRIDLSTAPDISWPEIPAN